MKQFKFHKELSRFLDTLDEDTFEREFRILSEMFRERERIMKVYESKSVFKRAGALDFSYIPPILKGRDDVMYSLIFHFRRILEEKETPSINYLLLGKAGTGKTLVARYFGKIFRTVANEKNFNINIEYFNCVVFRSKSKIIREILAKYTHTSGRGYSDDEALKLILTQLISEQGYLLLIIDEIHLLKSEEVLAFLNIAETFGHQRAKLSILLVSRINDWMRIETERILSRIDEKVRLNPYNFEEARKVLENRCELAFKDNVVSREIVDVISQIVVEYKNMSFGVKILRKCGIMADKGGLDHITLEMVQEASNEVYPTFRESIIDNLEDHELLTLYSIAKSLLISDEPFVRIDDTYEEYKYICEKYSIEPHIKMTFRKYVRQLNLLKIIYTKKVRMEEAERGRHLEITILDISSKKLEKLLLDIFDRKFSF